MKTKEELKMIFIPILINVFVLGGLIVIGYYVEQYERSKNIEEVQIQRNTVN